MAMKRTASEILAEQHWKRRILNNESTTTCGAEYKEVTNVNTTDPNNNSSNDVYRNEILVHEEYGVPLVHREPVQSTSNQQSIDVQFDVTQHESSALPVPVIHYAQQDHAENSVPSEHCENYNPNLVENYGGQERLPPMEIQVSGQATYNAVLSGNVEVQAAAETLTALQGARKSQDQVNASEAQQIAEEDPQQETFETRMVAPPIQEYSAEQSTQPAGVAIGNCPEAESLPPNEQNQVVNEEQVLQSQSDDINSVAQHLENAVPPHQQQISPNMLMSVHYNQDCINQGGATFQGNQSDTGHDSQASYGFVDSNNSEREYTNHGIQAPVINQVDSTELVQTKVGEIYSEVESNEQPEHPYQSFEVSSDPNHTQPSEHYDCSQVNKMQGTSGRFPSAGYDSLEPVQSISQQANCSQVHTPVHSNTTMNFYDGEQHSVVNSIPQVPVSTFSGYTPSDLASKQSLALQQHSNMNYQPYVAPGQPISSQDYNGACYDQPHSGCTALPKAQHGFHPTDVDHYPPAAVPQPKPSDDRSYEKNGLTYPSQHNPSENQHPLGVNSCIPSYLYIDDMHNGKPPIPCPQQLPDVMSRQDYHNGTEASKENFCGVNPDAGHHITNYHNRQVLTPMNVPPQYWSAPHLGTPVCPSKSGGPPRHYRPAPYTFPVCSCTPPPINMPSCRSCNVGHNHMTPRSRHPRSFNSSYTEYNCREDHKTHSRRSTSCCHIGQQIPEDATMHTNDQQYLMAPGMQPLTPKSQTKQIGDFSAEGARFHSGAFNSSSWNSFSSEMSSDSDSPMNTSRAQPGLGGSNDYGAMMERKVAPNSLANPNNPVLRSLPPPGLERTKFLVSTYIDYLIEENERITDMSKAFTPPTYLFLEEEQYVLQAHKNESPFPSNLFSKWIKQYFPQVDAISVPEIKSNGSCTNINRLQLSEKNFDEFAHIVFFGCQDLQEKRKIVPVQVPVPTSAPVLAQPVIGN